MGLDIRAYEKATLAEAISFEEMQARDWKHPLYDNSRFLFLFRGDFPEQADGMVDGFYTFGGEGFAFPAGSYHAYYAWREWLARLVGVTTKEIENAHGAAKMMARLTPFYALIHFTSSSGFIGPKTSAKLAETFDVFTERARASGDVDEMDVFKDFHKAFRIAAKGGFVRFH